MNKFAALTVLASLCLASTAAMATTRVPEPGTLGLMALGVAAIAATRIRRKK